MLPGPDTVGHAAPARILHVFGIMNRGGAETLVMNMYRAIDRSRLQFDFAVSTSKAGDYDDEIRSLGGRIFPHPEPASAGLVAYRRAFMTTIDRCGPFAGVHSHVHHFSGVVLEAAFRAGVARRLAHSHSTSDGSATSPLRSAYRAAMRWLMYRYATHLLGCSRDACEALYGRGCWREPRVQMIPNGIPLARFLDLTADAKALRRQLSLPDDACLVGHVGSFTTAKNHRFLIPVFAEFRRRCAKAQLVLIGDGPLRAPIEQLVRDQCLSGAVHFLGTRADVPELLGALDVFLLPSLWEGFPIALVEAQAAGIPCVVSDSVTPPADVGLQLVRFVDIHAGAQAWADTLLDALGITRPSRASCYRTLKAAGYDAADLCQRLCELYD